MSDLIERIENVLKMYENDVVEFPKWELRDAVDALRTQSSEHGVMVEALEKLSRLGNEPRLGNSDGNKIAQYALKRVSGRPTET